MKIIDKTIPKKVIKEFDKLIKEKGFYLEYYEEFIDFKFDVYNDEKSLLKGKLLFSGTSSEDSIRIEIYDKKIFKRFEEILEEFENKFDIKIFIYKFWED